MASPDRRPQITRSQDFNHPMTVTSKDLNAYPKKRILGGAAATLLGVLLMADGLRTHPNPPESIPDFVRGSRNTAVSTGEAVAGNILALAGILVPMADIAVRNKKRETKFAKSRTERNL